MVQPIVITTGSQKTRRNEEISLFGFILRVVVVALLIAVVLVILRSPDSPLKNVINPKTVPKVPGVPDSSESSSIIPIEVIFLFVALIVVAAIVTYLKEKEGNKKTGSGNTNKNKQSEGNGGITSFLSNMAVTKKEEDTEMEKKVKGMGLRGVETRTDIVDLNRKLKTTFNKPQFKNTRKMILDIAKSETHGDRIKEIMDFLYKENVTQPKITSQLMDLANKNLTDEEKGNKFFEISKKVK